MLWADAARGMAIALVVLHHAARRSVVAGSADWWLVVTNLLQTVRMPLLFTVAGIFAATWVSGRRSWPDLLRSKVLLFVWVYAVWLLLRSGVLAWVPGNAGAQDLEELAWRLLLPGAGWFVVALAAMFVLARLTRWVPTVLLLAAASAVSIVFLSGDVDTGSQAWNGLGTYTVFFLAGVALRAHVHTVADRVPRWAVLLVPVVWASAYAALAIAGLADDPVVGFLLRVAGVAAGVCVALVLQRWGALRTLGQRTLPVYMTHQVLIVPAVLLLSGVAAFDEHPVLHHGAPLLLGLALLALSYGFGRLAPRIGLGWLFATPRWLLRLTGAGRAAARTPATVSSP